MTLFVGVDPGLEGAIAVLEPDGRVRDVISMPVIAPAGGQGRRQYDLQTIADLLHAWRHEGAFVTVEKSQTLPPKLGGSIANFNRGVGRGWAWALAVLRIPYQLIPPPTWQKAMHLGTPDGPTKQRSILAAHRLFPGVRLQRTERARKESDGIAEALLLAEFGRRTHGGGARVTA